MTLKTTCKCGAEFYIGFADESHDKLELASQKYDMFMEFHKSGVHLKEPYFNETLF